MALFGPVAVAIDGEMADFKLYAGGIYDNSKCGANGRRPNHAVLVVGYGTENGQDYWIVKNRYRQLATCLAPILCL